MEWEDISDSIRIEEVIEALGIEVAFQDDEEYSASCPLPAHGSRDSNPSFSINVQKRVFNCFKCGGGSILHLVQSVEGLDYESAINWLMPYSDLLDDESIGLIDKVEKYLDRPRSGVSYHNRKNDLPWFSDKNIRQYASNMDKKTDWLKSRYINKKVSSNLQIGFDPTHERRDYIGPAIVIPHFFKGDLVGWQERWLDDDRPTNIGKYTNSSDFPKRYTLYNYDNAIAVASKQPIIVVESALTVARLLTSGYMAIATFGGGKIPDDQIQLLKSFPRLILSYDNDDAGDKAVRSIVKNLELYSAIEIIPPPDEDKADLGDLDSAELDHQIGLAVPSFLYQTRL